MKSETFRKEYKRLRGMNYTARLAYNYASVHEEWEELENKGAVKFEVNPEDQFGIEDYLSEGYTAKEKKETIDRINNEGAHYIASFILVNDKWFYIDSVGGFIGEDYKDSYDYDVKSSAIEAYKNSAIAANI